MSEGSDLSVPRRSSVEQFEIEVSPGDILRIGPHLVSIVDLHEGEVTFKILLDADDLALDADVVVRPR